jgi:hypothetical protein
VIVIKHWRINNYLQKDRYSPTKYVDEKTSLILEDNGAYTMHDDAMYTQDVDTQYRLGKVSIGKVSIDNSVAEATQPQPEKRPKRSVFNKPTVDEIRAYCTDRNNRIDAQRFFDYYESKGWLIGKTPMKDWKAAVRTWERGDSRGTYGSSTSNSSGDSKPKLGTVL